MSAVIKVGTLVRESKYRDIGRVISVPDETSKYYIVSFDFSKYQYTEEQVVSGALRPLFSVTP
jgi:hypothetical protein